MEILLVTGRFPQRSETFIYRKAIGLAKRGHRVTVAARDAGDWSLYPDPLPESLRVEVFPPDASLRVPGRAIAAMTGAIRSLSKSPSESKRLYDLCRLDRRTSAAAHRSFARHLPFVGCHPDVIHFEFLGLAVMYPLAHELTRSPVIVSCRGQDVHLLPIRSTNDRAALIECLRSVDALHCVSDELARSVTRVTSREHGIWTNRPAVDTDQIRLRSLGPASGPLRIVASGRLAWVKGFDYLLAALAKLANRGVHFHADILGDGDLKSPLRFSIGDLGLENHVTLVGGVSSVDVLSRLQSADVFVLSSIEEGISNGVLEAMASGVPIVTTAAGGMLEAVTDGVEGFVVPIRDVDALARRIEQLALDRELRIAMGRAARTRAVTDFSINRQVATFETIYQSVSRVRS